jgi:hypothetical protein
MKTLVIPDVHQDLAGVRKIFQLENLESFDEVIFLGDWLDSFHEPPKVSSFKDTCLFLRDLVWNNKSNKMVFLVGNHDLAYIYNNKKSGYSSIVPSLTYWCSGVTKNKIGTFRQVFYDKSLKDDWFIDNFKIAHKSQGWIFSHAGISRSACIIINLFARSDVVLRSLMSLSMTLCSLLLVLSDESVATFLCNFFKSSGKKYHRHDLIWLWAAALMSERRSVISLFV